MQSFSIWHLAVLAFWAIVIALPGWRIAEKAGYRGAWALLLLVPVVNLLAVWAFAFARWPAVQSAKVGMSPRQTGSVGGCSSQEIQPSTGGV